MFLWSLVPTGGLVGLLVGMVVGLAIGGMGKLSFRQAMEGGAWGLLVGVLAGLVVLLWVERYSPKWR